MEGDAIYTLSGHTSFVYSLASLPNGDIVSGGEDRTVRVWQGKQLTKPSSRPPFPQLLIASSFKNFYYRR
jgi:phospholipase A-2-activating protein